MRTRILLFAVLGLLISPLSSFSADMTAADLRYLTEDYPPYNYESDGRMTGMSVDLLRLMWQEMGVPEQPIRLVPWARGYKIVQEQPGSALFAMSRNEERENLFKWVGPITVNRHVLVTRADRGIRIGALDAAKAYRIGTILEDVADSLLVQAGFENLERVSDFRLNLRKLDAGRIDMVAYGETSFREQVEDPEKYTVVFVLRELQACYAFHRDTPDALVGNFQTALDRIRERPIYGELMERYFGGREGE